MDKDNEFLRWMNADEAEKANENGENIGILTNPNKDEDFVRVPGTINWETKKTITFEESIKENPTGYIKLIMNFITNKTFYPPEHEKDAKHYFGLGLLKEIKDIDILKIKKKKEITKSDILPLYSGICFFQNKEAIFKIEEKLKQILINTKNKIFLRNLPFDDFFINNFFVFDNSEELNGLRIFTSKEIDNVEGILYETYTLEDAIEGLEEDKIIYSKDKRILTIIRGRLGLLPPKNDPLISYHRFIQLFICNFLDFLNHPDVEMKIIKHPIFLQESRIKKGKPPISDRIEIIIKGKLSHYIYEEYPLQKEQHKSPSYSFKVRGHYIHFWNKKKWHLLYSMEINDLKEKGYQIDKEGIISKWIFPYIKGKGILKNKTYKLKKSENGNT